MYERVCVACSCTQRMRFALQQLFKTPQNNLRLFKVSTMCTILSEAVILPPPPRQGH